MKFKEINARFIDAIDEIKDKRIVTSYKDVYEKLGLTRGQWNGIKGHTTNVNLDEVNQLKKLYPFVEHHFEGEYKGSTDPEEDSYKQKYIKSLEEQAELLKKQLSWEEAMEEQNRLLKELLTLLKNTKD